MPEEPTAITSMDSLLERHQAAYGEVLSCGLCGMSNPPGRRSCLACGSPLSKEEHQVLPVDPPLLEREPVLQAIDEALEKMQTEGRGTSLVLAAPRGYGTTRLLRYAAEQLLKLDARVFSTTVREGDGPFAPVTRLLWERFGVSPSKGLQSARAELSGQAQRLFLSHKIPPTEHTRRLLVAAGLSAEDSRWESQAERDLPRLAESVSRFVILDAGTRPLGLLIDRAEAASEEGIALAQQVMQSLKGAPVFVLLTVDPSRPSALLEQGAKVLRLEPLSKDACRQLCRALLPGVESVPPALEEAVVQRSEGAPGKLRAILHALLESGVIRTDTSPWSIDLDAVGPDDPVSAGDLLEHRVRHLEPEVRAVLERAAVVGEVFWEGAVLAITRTEQQSEALFEQDRVTPAVREVLRQLVAAEFIAPIEESELALEREFAFAVPGLREMLLKPQDSAVRQNRHDITAAWLELAAGVRADDLARAIAGHLERAGLAPAAARAYLRAARVARQSYRGAQAVQLFDKALSLLSPGDAPVRVDALHDKGVVLSLLGRVDEAEGAFQAMLQDAYRYGARNKMAAALGRLGRLSRNRGEYDRARAYLWRALDLFQQSEDLRGVAAVQDDLGLLSYLAGDFEAALGHSTQALDIRRGLDDPLGEALSTYNLGLVHLARGQPRQARAHFERALALRERHGDVEGTTTTRNVLAILLFERGDFEQAEKIWREILALAETLEDRRMVAIGSLNLGEAALARGDMIEAASRLERAARVCAEIDDKRMLCETERVLGMLGKAKGDAAKAEAHLERSLEIARAVGLPEAEALALRGKGEVLAMRNDLTEEEREQAARHFATAVRTLEELGATRELARTRASFGRWLLERGERTSGRKLLTLAVPVLERLDLYEAPAARAALERAGGPMILPGAG